MPWKVELSNPSSRRLGGSGPRNVNGKSWPLLASRFFSPSSLEFQNSQPKKELQTGKIKAVVLNKLSRLGSSPGLTASPRWEWLHMVFFPVVNKAMSWIRSFVNNTCHPSFCPTLFQYHSPGNFLVALMTCPRQRLFVLGFIFFFSLPVLLA